MGAVTIQLIADMPPAALVDVPRTETFAVVHNGVVKATDSDVPRDQDPRQYAAFIAAQLGVPFVAPRLGVCFGCRDNGSWFGYRIARGGSTGSGRRSSQPPIVFRRPERAVA